MLQISNVSIFKCDKDNEFQVCLMSLLLLWPQAFCTYQGTSTNTEDSEIPLAEETLITEINSFHSCTPRNIFSTAQSVALHNSRWYNCHLKKTSTKNQDQCAISISDKTGLHSIPGISQYDRKQDCPISEKVQVKVKFHDPRSLLLRQDRLIVQTIKKSIPSPKFV